jgi:hypothetical protein
MKIADTGKFTALRACKIVQLAAASIAIAVPLAASSGKPAPAARFLDFYCKYGDKGDKIASKAHSEGFNFSFKPSVPYDFIDMFGFGHSIRTATVTPDQVVEQSVLMNDSKHPSRAEIFDVTTMDRKTLKFRRIIYKVDQRTFEHTVDTDRSGQCSPVQPRAGDN